MKHQSYIQQHGTSYYLANLFFPRQLQQAVMTLYAFVRIPDDVVDDHAIDDDYARSRLQEIEQTFLLYYAGEKERGSGNVFSDTAQLFHAYNINPQWATDFFVAMTADTHTKSYQTYEQLQQYMYGSAEVVGLMMCKLIGYDRSQEGEVFRTGSLLGEAMQYTNFLRDIQEDYTNYGRIYIPTERLSTFGLSHQDIISMTESKTITESWKSFMKEQIAQTRKLYQEANTGIKHLDRKGRKAVYIASKMYEGILDQIESIDYNMFAADAHTSKWHKLWILTKSVIQYAIIF